MTSTKRQQVTLKDFYLLKINDVRKRMEALKRAYHGWGHVLDVILAAENIAEHSYCTADDINLLKTAALYHDLGFEISAKDHEEHSVKLFVLDALEILTAAEIEAISGLIMATKMPHNPKTKLQKIIVDADLSYIAFSDYSTHAELLRIELKMDLGYKWTEMQKRFLYDFEYKTKYMQEKCDNSVIREIRNKIQ